MDYDDYIKENMTIHDLARVMVMGFKEVTQRIDFLEATTVIKEDLRYFATKEDLKQFATKDDLKSFATRDDLQKMERRLSQKIDQNYIHVNRRVDLLAENVS